MAELEGFSPAPPAAQLFGNAGREHMRKYGKFCCIWKHHNHTPFLCVPCQGILKVLFVVLLWGSGLGERL